MLSNVTAAPVTEVEEVRETLAAQVCAPVLWERSMGHALAGGTKEFLEVAPGTILAGILRKIDAEPTVHAAATPADLDALAGTLGLEGA